MDKRQIQRVSLLFDGLVIFNGLNRDQQVLALRNLLRTMAAEEANPDEIFRTYHEFLTLAHANWPAHLWDLILQDENELTRQIALGQGGISPELGRLVLRDLVLCREISEFSSSDIKLAAQARMAELGLGKDNIWSAPPLAPESWPGWEAAHDSVKHETHEKREKNYAENYLRSARERVMNTLTHGEPEEMLEALSAYYVEIGTGLFSRSLALKWKGSLARLEGVRPDPMRKEELIGQEREQRVVLQNTEFFLAGYPANNVILYGNRGTGKSSLVKALLQEYCDRGLRLVELSKSDLNDFPKVIRILEHQALKFIVFIDDLSFEDTESDYKNLKTLLEGGLEGKPKNVLIYATSNRRHLIRENFSERQGDEVHRRDNMEEKLSLSDRFGIMVTFLTPDQEGYLRIVEELASQQGLTMDRELLRQQALRWVMQQNARSGRTARQFIDYLAASQGAAAK